MPKIVRFGGGLSLSEEAVKIRDVGPSLAPARKKKQADAPAPDEFVELDLDAMDGAEGDEAGGEDPEAGFEDEPAFEAVDIANQGSRPAPGADARAEVIQAAMAEAGRIIEDAVRQGEEKKAELLAEAQYQGDRLRAEAEAEGRKLGLAAATEEIQRVAGGIEEAVATFEGERAGFEAEYEEQLKWLAIEIASKVLAKKVGDDDAEMSEMVQKAVQSVKSEPWIRIEVAQEMTRLIDDLTARYGADESIEVSAIPAAPGTVHIETPSGVVDASLKTQLANLRDYFSQSAN